MGHKDPNSDIKLSAMDEQGVFDILLNDELPAFIRALLFVVWYHEGMRRLLLYNVLSLQVLFWINHLELRNFYVDL